MKRTAIGTKPATEETALAKQGQSLAELSTSLMVQDQVSFDLAVSYVTQIDAYLERVAEITDPVVKAAHAAWQAALVQRHGFQDKALAAKERLRKQMGAFELEQQRLKREAEEAAQRELERLQEAERQRVKQEQDRLLEEARQAQAAQAAEARGSGDEELARRVEAQLVETPVVQMRPVFVPPVEVNVPTSEAVSFRSAWSAKVTDLKKLVAAVAAGTVPIGVIAPDQDVLDQMARALKGSFSLPGVEGVENRIPVRK